MIGAGHRSTKPIPVEIEFGRQQSQPAIHSAFLLCGTRDCFPGDFAKISSMWIST
jgi:hypothetical protein